MTVGSAERACAPHVPVLLAEVLAALDLPGAGLAVDGTFGAGGYTRAMLAADPDLRVIGIDRDPSAIAGGTALVAASNGRLTLVPGRFGSLDAHLAELGQAQADRIVLDIGVSSMQIDQPERGFSFRNDGPLDMRMAATGTSAADLVNEAEEAELADIIYHYGEERRSRAVARTIIEARRRGRIETTAQLADLVAGVVRTEPGSGIHPATRTFQGLRIAVNDELGELVRGLAAAERLLKPGGRLAIVSFHSLEDRIVKQFLARRSGRGEAKGRRLPGEPAATLPSFTLPRGQPIVPSETEAKANPRARSAKLRTGLRTDNPAIPLEPELVKLATLPHRVTPKSGKPR